MKLERSRGHTAYQSYFTVLSL